jgi:hypothetical protein
MKPTIDANGRALRVEGQRLTVENWRFAIEADGRTCRMRTLQCETHQNGNTRVRIEFENTPVNLEMTFSTDGSERLTGTGRLTNTGDVPVRLDRVTVLDADWPAALSPADTVCLPLPGHISPRFVYRLTAPDCPADSKIKALYVDRAAGTALLAGFLSFHRTDTVVHHSKAESGVPTGLSATCDFAGWQLGAGKTTALETFVLSAGPDPYALLEAWADDAARLCAPRRWEDVPIGWLGWAWVDAFNVENYEETMLRNCRAIRRRLPGHPVNYIWLSIGNIQGGMPGNWLEWDKRNLPSGPQGLVAKLRELGFKLGLWCAPFYVCSALENLVAELDDALLRRNGERMVVRPEWSYGDAGCLPKAERPCMYALDPSHPKAHAFVRKVFETYRAWGIRYYMVDFLNSGSGNIGQFVYDDHHDRNLVAGPEAYQSLMETIRDAAGDDTYLLSSSGPMVHNAGVFDAIRTGNDFGEGRQLSPESFFYPATYVINGGEFWTGPLYALRNQACAYYTHRRLYINDSGNVLTLDSPLPLSDAQIHATIHTMGASPAMLGDDVDRMSEARVDLLRKTLPRPHDVAIPVDLFDTPHPDHPKVFLRTVTTDWDTFRVVALYNMSAKPFEAAVPFEYLGIGPDSTQAVWEFWNQQYIGLATDNLNVTVPPRSVCVVRLTDAHPRPHLLGTDMHITMGETDVQSCAWDPKNATLTGTALRPTGETGSIFIRAPQGWTVATPEKVWIAKDATEHCLICKISLEFQQSTAHWAIGFAKENA